MGRRLAPITLDLLDDLPTTCRRCVFWELDPLSGRRAQEGGDPGLEKEAWLSGVLLEWGSCGRLVYVDDAPAGYAMYAPPALVPRAVSFPTSPVSPDAVLLAGLMVLPEFAGGGLGRMLVQAVAKDLTRRGVRAIESFGYAPPRSPAKDVEAGGDGRSAAGGGSSLVRHGPWDPRQRDTPGCVVPADFLLSVGFKTVRPHHRVPRLRLDLRSTLSWREDVEQAIERILGSVRAPVLTGS